MNKKFQYKNIILGALLVAMLTCLNVSAQAILAGSESKGYLVSTSKQGKNTDTFDDSALNTTYKGYTSAGVSRWKATGVMTFKRDTSSKNKIITYSTANTGAVAYTSYTIYSTSGKIASFKIAYNKAYMEKRTATQNKGTAGHELGHAIGLLDLYKASNKDKLMYGVSDRTVYSPTKSDIAGAKIAVK